MKKSSTKQPTNPLSSDCGNCSQRKSADKYTELLEVLSKLPQKDLHIVSSFVSGGNNYLVLLHHEISYDGMVKKWEFKIKRQEDFFISDSETIVASARGTLLYENVLYGNASEQFKKYKHILIIVDFKTRIKDFGFGTILMEHVLNYAKKCNAEEISGSLSFVDNTEDNEERRNHFYQKFGFEIESNDKIRLKL